jgi:hypothetical protein
MRGAGRPLDRRIRLSHKYPGVLLAYVAIGIAAYWPALGGFFVSDDFDFLRIAKSATSPLVCFEPIYGRFIRPSVLFMYYASYHTFGLMSWPYHLAVLIPHLLSAWLVFLVARKLFVPSGRLLPFLAGLLFLLFSAHSEAVAWPADVGDPVLTACLLVAFLCFLRAIDPRSSRMWMAWSFVAMLGGAFGKEAWVVYPGILVAYMLTIGCADRECRRRGAILIGLGGLAVLLYLAMRQQVFGSVAGGYAGLGTSLRSELWFTEARAFLLRCFVPAGLWMAKAWPHHLDLFAWLILLAVGAVRLHGRELRVVGFFAAAMVLSLLPVLPLTISMVTTESERLTYLASAFSVLLAVSAIAAFVRQRQVAAAICMALIGWHSVVLVQNVFRWRANGALARGILMSFARQLREHDPRGEQQVFLLNLPDNLYGAYTFRNGFYSAVQLFEPEIADSTARTIGIATNSLTHANDRVTIRRPSPDRFVLDVGMNMLIQPTVPSSIWYHIVRQGPTSYEVQFAETIGSALVLCTDGGQVRYAGTVRERGMPFGAIDLPAASASCTGPSLRFSGWALGERGVTRVIVERLDGTFDGETAKPVGEATWSTGTHPDVARTFSWLPNSDRAGWDFMLPCAQVAAAPGVRTRIRVTAIDADGRSATLGIRAVSAGP